MFLYQQNYEEGSANKGGNNAHREFRGLDDAAGDGVGEDDEGGATEGAHGNEDAMVGPEDEAEDVGGYEADEGDGAAYGYGGAGDQGGSTKKGDARDADADSH